MRNRKALPKRITRPVLVYFDVTRYYRFDGKRIGLPDDRLYIVWPNGRVNNMDLSEGQFGDQKFSNKAAINNPGQGWSRVREAFQERVKGGTKITHWEYL